MTRFFTLCFTLLFAVTANKVAAQVPKLNSLTTASSTIYLDFDGQTVNTPYWNSGTAFYATAPALTSTQITTIFNQVAEDFRAFNLNITTDSTVYFAAPSTRRQRIIITSYSTWYGRAGGVAYAESFRWGIEVPGFVFADLLGLNPKNLAEASSHESGHTLGLYHQTRYDAACNFVSEYNPGTGTGETSWAPIMGNSYSKTLTLWHNGTSVYGCNTPQSDLTILASNSNGFGLKADDIENTTNRAANVIFNGAEFASVGFINSASDVDVFRVSITQNWRGVINITPNYTIVNGYKTTNIDVEVDLLNGSGSVIKTYSPTTSTAATIDTNLNSGTYFLRVKSTTNNPNISNYGMLGDYVIQGAPLAALPVHSLNLSGAVTNNKHELNWNIVADEPIESIAIEASTDGKTFSTLQDVNNSLRKFVYQPFEKGTVYYRVYVVTVSQLKYYSNIISLKEAKAAGKYNLLTNVISGTDISINSTGNYAWKLIDMNGRNMGNGKMTNGYNRLDASKMSSGMYLLQIIDGTEISTEKIVKK